MEKERRVIPLHRGAIIEEQRLDSQTNLPGKTVTTLELQTKRTLYVWDGARDVSEPSRIEAVKMPKQQEFPQKRK